MRLRFDFASKIARHKNVEDLDAAGLRIAVTQMYSLLTTFDPALLNPKIANHPGAYSRILNSLCKLTEAGIKCDHHRLAQPSKRASKIAPKPRSKRS
jgi:CHAD domain-containing protein